MTKRQLIRNFCTQMQSLGYVEGEVNAFVHDIVDDRDVSSLSDNEWEDIEDQLNGYLVFARKCKKVSVC